MTDDGDALAFTPCDDDFDTTRLIFYLPSSLPIDHDTLSLPSNISDTFTSLTNTLTPSIATQHHNCIYHHPRHYSPGRSVTLADIVALPRTSHTTTPPLPAHIRRT